MTRIAILALLLLLPAGVSAGKGQAAFWRSLLVPGWGQRYATGSGGRFFVAELAFWGGYLGFERLREVRRDQYQAFAATHAGARTQGKDGEYFEDLGFYQSRLEHNQFARYEDGPEAVIYPLGRDFFWEWDRQASRERYRQLRNSTAGAGRQALFMTGLVAVNHLFSAIHAARTASGEVRTDIVPIPEQDGAALLLVHRF